MHSACIASQKRLELTKVLSRLKGCGCHAQATFSTLLASTCSTSKLLRSQGLSQIRSDIVESSGIGPLAFANSGAMRTTWVWQKCKCARSMA